MEPVSVSGVAGQIVDAIGNTVVVTAVVSVVTRIRGGRGGRGG